MTPRTRLRLTLGLRWLREFLEEPPTKGGRVRRAIQFAALVLRGFAENRCPVRAAALSYTTLLALVPLLAVALSVSRNVLRETSAEMAPKLLDKLVVMIAPQLEYAPVGEETAGALSSERLVVSERARREVVEKIQSFLAKIDAGALGVIGSLFLTGVAIRLLMSVEQTFNDIWGVSRGRSIWRKIVYYWATLTLGPTLLLAAMYVTGRTEFSAVYGTLRVAPGFEKVMLHLLPFLVLWAGFSLLYGLVPNTRVRVTAALAGGMVAGTLWQLNSLLSTLYLSRVVTYSKIYGALGILPVFLVGLYFSWLVVLFGAQVAFAAQNVRAYWQQRAAERLDQQARELLACRAVGIVCHRFDHGASPPTVEELAEKLGASLDSLNRLLHRLVEGGVLVRITDPDDRLQPARPTSAITLADVLHVMRTREGRCGESPRAEERDEMATRLCELRAAERAASGNARFSDLRDGGA